MFVSSHLHEMSRIGKIIRNKKLISGYLGLWLGNEEGLGTVSGYGVSLRGDKKMF